MRKPFSALLILLTILLLTLAAFIALVFSFHQHPHPKLVHPEIAKVSAPLAEIKVGYHSDGGSLSVFGRDGNGEEFLFMLPHPMGSPAYFDTLYVGHYMDGVRVDEGLFPDSRAALFNMVSDSKIRTKNTAQVLWKLNDVGLVKVRLFLQTLLGRFSESDL